MSEDERLKNFKGIMIEVSDKPMFDLTYRVPGWECEICGWRVGASGYPPPHTCPADGIQQQCTHEWGEDRPHENTKRDIMCRQCTKCDKREYRFVESKWLND